MEITLYINDYKKVKVVRFVSFKINDDKKVKVVRFVSFNKEPKDLHIKWLSC